MSPAAIVLAAALPCLALAAPAEDPDFEPVRPATSAAMGPAPRGGAVFSVDVGWLRSGLALRLGMTGWLDLAVLGDTALLYDGFGGHSALAAGLRLTPISDGRLRVSVELTAGKLLVPTPTSTEVLTTYRGELVAGVVLDVANVYARASMRAVSSAASVSRDWGRDEEVGIGAERVFGRYSAGAELYGSVRPGHAGLAQWRIRGALAF